MPVFAASVRAFVTLVPMKVSISSQSGSGGALPRRRLLGTGRARFPGDRLGQALLADGVGLQQRWSTAVTAWRVVAAVGVNESERDGSAVAGGSGVEGDRVVAGRRADGCDPLFPLVGMLWLLFGVQEKLAAERAASRLPLEQPQPGGVQRGFPASPPGCPVP
jgi:hypothetical protein